MSKSNKLPKGVELTMLKDNFNVANTEYSAAFSRAKKLDMVDKNKLWRAVSAQYPSYQILPETNHVSYIKNNILASIYTVGKCASILPTSEQDREIVMQLNIALEQIWSQLDVPYYQLLAGERAALLNLGVTQVGWDNNVVSGKDKTFQKGRCVLKNINPLHYMRDPFAPTLDEASYVITWEEYHKSVLLANENYKDSFKEFLEKHKGGMEGTSTIQPDTDRVSKDANGKKDYYKLFTHWVRVADKIHEIHTINNEFVLYVREAIQPAMFPFAELFCNLPDESLLGVSEPNKILANSLAYNIMQSIMLTADYKNQRPPKFINSASGLNINSFKKHGNEADYTFVVNGDASRAVHYHQFPAPSATAPTNMAMLANDIKNITGVDDRYTGRDTGSILTTGGVNSMLDQVTMIDAPKVLNYEHYCKTLTQLILFNYINFSAIKRRYFVRDKRNPKKWNGVEVDFPSIDNDTVFDYEINISSELPKNKTVVANMANKMMEMQMQYSAQNIEVDLITPQEWLMLQQDLPIKEYMLERMGLQRTSNWVEATAQIVTQYTSLIEQGVNPNDALQTTAATMEAQSSPNGGVENVVNSIQNGLPY
jgi:hypothetical protein